MPAFHHILFPVDFSDRCGGVKPFVTWMTKQFRSKLTLMHVVQIPTGWYGGIDGGYPILYDQEAMEDAAQVYIAHPQTLKVVRDDVAIRAMNPMSPGTDFYELAWRPAAVAVTVTRR